LRVSECDGLDTEPLAEIERGSAQREMLDGRPEIEVVTTAPTGEAVEQMTLDVDAEAPRRSRMSGMRGEETAATPLVAASVCGLVSQQVQHLAHADLLADDQIIERRHEACPVGSSCWAPWPSPRDFPFR